MFSCRRIFIVFLFVLSLSVPDMVLAYQAGDYVVLHASVTSVIQIEQENTKNEDYESEGSYISDTHTEDYGSDLLGYGELRYPVSVAFAGDIRDISADQSPDIFQFRQELQIDSSEIARLFQEYRSDNIIPQTPTRFVSVWDDIVNEYAGIIGELPDSIDLYHLALERLFGIHMADMLNQIPRLMATGDLTIHVDVNTNPITDESHLLDIFALMMDIGARNWETAQNAAEEAKSLIAGSAYAGTQIVGRPDLYEKSSYNGNSAFNYDGNILTIYIRNHTGAISGNDLSAGRLPVVETITGASQYWNDGDLEKICIPASAENVNRITDLRDKLDNMKAGSSSYTDVLTTISDAFPEYGIISAEKPEEGCSYPDENSAVDVFLSFPETNGLVTDYYGTSGSTAATFGTAISVLMRNDDVNVNQYVTDFADSTDLHDDETDLKAALTDEFINTYLIGAGHECLYQNEFTVSYPQDAYTPNKEIYSIDSKYTGNFGSVVRFVTGDIPAYNNITGSTEMISHASESEYDYICFCAGTNGWIRITDGRGLVRFVRYTEFMDAANAAAMDHGYGPDLVSDCYMVCAGESNNKGHVLEVRLDIEQLAANMFQELTARDLQDLLDDQEITLQDLLAFTTGDFNFSIQAGRLSDDYSEIVGLTGDWWKKILAGFANEYGASSASGADSDPGISGSNPYGTSSAGKAFFSIGAFAQWLIDQGYITEEDSSGRSAEDEIRWMTDYFPQYLNHYSGVLVFSVDRIITKQLKSTTSRATSRLENVGFTQFGGTHKWVVTTNGFPSMPYYGGSESGVTLSAGITSVSATEAVRRIYEEIVTYDYTEEWILEPFGFVIFRKTVSGQLAGMDGQDHDVNALYFSTTLGPITEVSAGNWTFVTDDGESGQSFPENDPWGIVSVYGIQGSYWINGIPSSDFGICQTPISQSGSSAYCYRIR